MKHHHTILLSNFFVFLVGMILGAILGHNPLLWTIVILLVAVTILLATVSATKPKRRRRGVRATKTRNAETGS